MTPFHTIARGKGWRLAEIGKLWGISERQMSRVANRPSRKDLDAVRGLPNRLEDSQSGGTMRVNLTVNHHPSGRLTLKEQTPADRQPRDCDGDLFGNMDPASFYRAVAQRIADLQGPGVEVLYKDSADAEAK
ncbi:hypothetical protein [Marinobacter halodurans]|uniref:hypothetical protein n=1 Tax=Marinobacter halodurans TaxID=2528979 RepID=UPI0013F1565C|nr:hypothetical protein [Marinobacter halodurans]